MKYSLAFVFLGLALVSVCAEEVTPADEQDKLTTWTKLKPVPSTRKPSPKPTCQQVECDDGYRCYNGLCLEMKPVPTTPIPTQKPSCEDIVCEKNDHCWNGECVKMHTITCANLRCVSGSKCLEKPARCVAKTE